MIDELDKLMISKFLIRNYPITRIKDGTRFKRGIMIDNGSVVLLSNEFQHIALIQHLTKIIKLVFYCRDELCREMVKKHLNIK